MSFPDYSAIHLDAIFNQRLISMITLLIFFYFYFEEFIGSIPKRIEYSVGIFMITFMPSASQLM